MMHYCIKILNLDNDKLVKIIYNMQRNDANNKFSYNWAYQLKDMREFGVTELVATARYH